MPPKQTNRLPLHSANERGSSETIGTSIGCDTRGLASHITLGSGNPRVPMEAENEEDFNRGNRIMEQDKNTLSDAESDHADNTPEVTESCHDKD